MVRPYSLMPHITLTAVYYSWGQSKLTADMSWSLMMAIIKDETTDSINTILNHQKETCGFCPHFIMLDDSAAYQKAAKEVFPVIFLV